MIRQFYLIRHGRTKGNLEGRYVGITDEPLCQEGRAELLQFKGWDFYPEVQAVFTSPLRRCKETSLLIYPDKNPQIITSFCETNFGKFEYKNYEELNGDTDYQRWIDSGGKAAIPGGESRTKVQHRLAHGFLKMMKACEDEKIDTAAVIAHGGTIMELMNMYGFPEEDFYHWQVKNGCGIAAEVEIEDGKFTIRFSDWIRP